MMRAQATLTPNSGHCSVTELYLYVKQGVDVVHLVHNCHLHCVEDDVCVNSINCWTSARCGWGLEITLDMAHTPTT